MLRWIALLSAGAFGLHQLRFLAGDPSHTHGALSGHPHAYMPFVFALVALLFLASLAHFVSSLMLARSGELPESRPLRFAKAWPWATVVLLGIFVTQESFEGALLGGHTSGAHGLFGHSGWTVFVFAPLLGALIALVMRGANSMLLAAARRARRGRPRPSRGRWRLLPGYVAPQLDVLACHLAGRAPPALIS
jgi:hypothetical protein